MEQTENKYKNNYSKLKNNDFQKTHNLEDSHKFKKNQTLNAIYKKSIQIVIL